MAKNIFLSTVTLKYFKENGNNSDSIKNSSYAPSLP